MKNASKVLFIIGIVWFILGTLLAIGGSVASFWLANSATDAFIKDFFKAVFKDLPGETDAAKIEFIRAVAAPYGVGLICYSVFAISSVVLSFINLTKEKPILYVCLAVLGFVFGNVFTGLAGIFGYIVCGQENSNKTPAPAQ